VEYRKSLLGLGTERQAQMAEAQIGENVPPDWGRQVQPPLEISCW